MHFTSRHAFFLTLLLISLPVIWGEHKATSYTNPDCDCIIFSCSLPVDLHSVLASSTVLCSESPQVYISSLIAKCQVSYQLRSGLCESVSCTSCVRKKWIHDQAAQRWEGFTLSRTVDIALNRHSDSPDKYNYFKINVSLCACVTDRNLYYQ
jgi:hypothetical protein